MAAIALRLIQAIAKGGRSTATLVDRHPRATSTGADIGGARGVDWTPA